MSQPPNVVGRVDVLDYARFGAAIAVMLFHYTCAGIGGGNITSISQDVEISDYAKYGYLGVELFFMISGYVIFISAKNRSASHFVVARALRLYPAFLAGVLLTSFIACMWGGKENGIYLSQFLFNLTMVPKLFGRNYVDGSYWTLVLELQFYALVFCLMLFGKGEKLGNYLLVWPVLILAASFMGGRDWPIVGGYYSYFAAGALFALKKQKSTLSINVLLVLCFYESINFSAHSRSSEDSIFQIAAPIALIIFGFYILFCTINFVKVSAYRLPYAKWVGAITYPVYLIHQTIGYIFISHFGNEQNKRSIVLAAILLSLMLAYMINRYVEGSLKSFWKRFFVNTIGAPLEILELKISKLRKLNSLAL